MQALINWGFCDLSISKDYDLSNLKNIAELGFNSIALDTHVEDSTEPPKKKKKKTDTKEKIDFIPPKSEIPEKIRLKSNLKILHRLTLEFSDSSISHKINQSDNIKQYDIIAVLPKTLQAFQYACSSMDIDIITFAPESRLPYKISRKLYRQAAERGIFFEIMYSPAIKDSTCRKNIISTAHTYHAIGKSRNIIVTSAAKEYSHVRGVHDVINLGFILGLNSQESIEVIKNNARKLILRAKGRKCGKNYIEISTINETKEIEIYN